MASKPFLISLKAQVIDSFVLSPIHQMINDLTFVILTIYRKNFLAKFKNIKILFQNIMCQTGKLFSICKGE